MNTIKLRKRILAILIDYCIAFLALLGIGCAVAIIFGLFRIGGKEFSDPEAFVSTYTALIFIFIYYGHPFKKQGQTFGEKMMKFKIVPAKGGKIGFWAALVRTMFFAPILVIIGLIVIDKTTSTRVLEYLTKTKAEATLA